MKSKDQMVEELLQLATKYNDKAKLGHGPSLKPIDIEDLKKKAQTNKRAWIGQTSLSLLKAINMLNSIN